MELSQREIYELALETMSRTDRKTIHSVMTRVHRCSREQAAEHLETWKGVVNPYVKNVSSQKGIVRDMESVLKMYDILMRKGLTPEFIETQWAKVKQERSAAVSLYKGRPVREKKDNRRAEDGPLYTGPVTTIARFPKRNRSKKTWENFWKLFPAFKGYYTLNEYNQACWKKSKEEALLKEQS